MIKEIIIFAISLVALWISLIFMPRTDTKIYDCGMAEWHPDIPPKVKEECRKLKSNEQRIQEPRTPYLPNGKLHQPV